MVTVDYFGRIGNNLFQYIMARLLAIKNGQNLDTVWPHDNFIETKPFREVPERGRSPSVTLEDREDSHLNYSYLVDNIKLHGYFQDAEFYNDQREIIKSFFVLPKLEKNTKDIVIHLRLTDYWWRHNNCVIAPNWYFDILLGEKNFRKLYIVVEPHCTNKRYLQYFRQYEPEIISGTPKNDFEFLMSFDRIVCSNSTFAWWAAFLGDASKIYLFKPWMGYDRACQKLTKMAGATVVDGPFLRNKVYANLDWSDYWKKPDEYFGRA